MCRLEPVACRRSTVRETPKHSTYGADGFLVPTCLELLVSGSHTSCNTPSGGSKETFGTAASHTRPHTPNWGSSCSVAQRSVSPAPPLQEVRNHCLSFFLAMQSVTWCATVTICLTPGQDAPVLHQPWEDWWNPLNVPLEHSFQRGTLIILMTPRNSVTEWSTTAFGCASPFTALSQQCAFLTLLVELTAEFGPMKWSRCGSPRSSLFCLAT